MNYSTAIILALVLISAVTGCQRRPKNAVEMKLPTGTPQQPKGIAALSVTPGPTPFTTNEVTQYIQSHRLGKSIGDPSQLQVESLEFITASEVTVRLQGASTGLPATHRVAFAVIRGPLYFTGPPSSKPVQFERAYTLFDAGTGNLLMSGTLNASKQPVRGTNQPPR
jgi:hypothetical protein